MLAKLQLARMQQSLSQPLDATTRTWLQEILTALIPEIDNALQMIQTATFTLYAAGFTEVGLGCHPRKGMYDVHSSHRSSL